MPSKFSLQYTASFDEDLRNIYKYIAHNLQNPEAASEQVDRIMLATTSIALFPKAYRVRGNNRYGKEVRFFPVDNYVIIYSVDDANYIVNILRVLYGRRNMNYFFSLD